MPLKAYITSVTLNSGEIINFEEGEFILIVGPNNSGKSVFLHDLSQWARGSGHYAKIISQITFQKGGDKGEVWDLIRNAGSPVRGARVESYNIGRQTDLTEAHSQNFFSSPFLDFLDDVLIHHMRTDVRQQSSNTAQSIDFGSTAPSHPLQFLHQDEELRRKLGIWFKRAFGEEIAIDINAGSVIPIHVGIDAEPKPNESPYEKSYLKRLRSLPRIDEQGDGVRSFLGVILYAIAVKRMLVFIDEPEAFLHPPQAKMLGKILAEERDTANQIVAATHSVDFLRGVLETGRKVRVIRITRNGNVNHVRELSPERIVDVWSSPALRYSNILDGIFHQKVVVCEADGDCRFYGAIADALRHEADHPFVRDVMFTQAGGKGGMAKLLGSLRELAVPVVAVTDFDVLRDQNQLWSIVRSLGGDPNSFRNDYDIVRGKIESLSRETSAARIKKELSQAISEIPDDGDAVPRGIRERISKLLRYSLGWQIAKESGMALLGTGEACNAGHRLLSGLMDIGLHVVPFGEMESFVPSETDSKDRWVMRVLEEYSGTLMTSQQLENARNFVKILLR